MKSIELGSLPTHPIYEFSIRCNTPSKAIKLLFIDARSSAAYSTKKLRTGSSAPTTLTYRFSQPCFSELLVPHSAYLVKNLFGGKKLDRSGIHHNNVRVIVGL